MSAWQPSLLPPPLPPPPPQPSAAAAASRDSGTAGSRLSRGPATSGLLGSFSAASANPCKPPVKWARLHGTDDVVARQRARAAAAAEAAAAAAAASSSSADQLPLSPPPPPPQAWGAGLGACEPHIDYQCWEDVPPPRTKFSTVVYEGKLVVYGGGLQKVFHGDVYVCDLGRRPAASPEDATTTGEDSSAASSSSSHPHQHPQQEARPKPTWRCVQRYSSRANGPCPRRSHKVVLRGNEMVLFGGRGAHGRLHDVFTLNLDTWVWTNRTPSYVSGPAPVERAAHSCVLWGHRMIVFGGDYESREGCQSYLRDLWELDLDTWRWRELHPAGDVPTARLGHDAAVSGNSMYVFGGYQASRLNDMFVIDLSVGVWRRVWRLHSVEPTSFLAMAAIPYGAKPPRLGGGSSDSTNNNTSSSSSSSTPRAAATASASSQPHGRKRGWEEKEEDAAGVAAAASSSTTPVSAKQSPPAPPLRPAAPPSALSAGGGGGGRSRGVACSNPSWPYLCEGGALRAPQAACLVVWGGSHPATNTCTDVLLRFDIEREDFEELQVVSAANGGEAPSARLGHTMSHCDGAVYLFGGCDSAYFNDLYRLELGPPSLREVMRHYITSLGLRYCGPGGGQELLARAEAAAAAAVARAAPPSACSLDDGARAARAAAAAAAGASPSPLALPPCEEEAAEGEEEAMESGGFDSPEEEEEEEDDAEEDQQSETETVSSVEGGVAAVFAALDVDSVVGSDGDGADAGGGGDGLECVDGDVVMAAVVQPSDDADAEEAVDDGGGGAVLQGGGASGGSGAGGGGGSDEEAASKCVEKQGSSSAISKT